MGAGGVSPPPRPLASRTSASRQWTASPMATFCAVGLMFARKTVMRGADMVGVRYANKLRENIRCSGDRPPGHAAYAPLAFWRNSKKLPSPPFKAARPLWGCGYFLETLRSGASVRLRRTHPCAYCISCFRLCRHCAPFFGRAGTRLRYRHTGAAAP